MKLVPLKDCTLIQKEGFRMIEAFDEVSAGRRVRMGLVELEPDQDMTDLGIGSHDGDEFAYIMEGEFEAEVNGEYCILQQGDFSLIPKGSLHRTFRPVSKPVKLVWMIVE